MRRPAFILVLVLSLGAIDVTSAAEPPPPVKVWRIGWLGLDSSMQATRIVAFQNGLRALGYVEGRNVHIEEKWAEGHFDLLPQLAAELVASNVDVIVTASPPGARAAQRASSTIPIVMIAHEPVRMGLVKSLDAPGGNITGIAFQDTDLSTKRLDLFRQALPRLSRIVILWNGVEGTDAKSLQTVEDAAKSIGLLVLSLEVREARDFAPVVERARAWGADGILEMASPFITKNRGILLDLLSAHHIPATCEMRMYVVEGCLMTYSASLDAMFLREAYFVDRIFRGESPSSMAIEQPQEFEFVINMKTANELGLTLPEPLLLQANEVLR